VTFFCFAPAGACFRLARTVEHGYFLPPEALWAVGVPLIRARERREAPTGLIDNPAVQRSDAMNELTGSTSHLLAQDGFIGSPLFFVIMGVALVGLIGLLIYLRSRPRDE
jgi:hypothetical protein